MRAIKDFSDSGLGADAKACRRPGFFSEFAISSFGPVFPSM